MTEEKFVIKGEDVLELLKFNHRGLHESVWHNHRIAWLVTSIFIPVLFAMLGYLIREYDSLLKFQLAMGFLVTEGLLVIWLFIMRILKHYNAARFDRLKSIEDKFNEVITIPGIDFNQYRLEYGEKPKRYKFSPMRIYWMLFAIYTVLNIVLLAAKCLA